MNKIEKKTYLYNEVIKGLKSSYVENIILVKSNVKNKKRVNKKLIYIVSPNLRENEEMYFRLFKDKADYIYMDSYKIVEYYNKKYMVNIKISDGTAMYVSLKNKVSEAEIKYIYMYIAISLADFIIINKISSISDGIAELDIALDLGKEIYAFPGDIFEYKNYLSNFAIKQGATPICSIYDIDHIF